MKCNLCIEKEKTWSSKNSPIECAFDNKSKIFSSDNWNCWTLDFFRDYLIENETSIWNNDSNWWIIPYHIENEKNEDIWFIFLEWYKSRWNTEKIIDLNKVNSKWISLSKLEKIILYLKK